jgi:hypothetical protein
MRAIISFSRAAVLAAMPLLTACGGGGSDGGSIGGAARLLDPEFEASIIDLEIAWTDAVRTEDEAALDTLLADDFTLAGAEPDARLMPKRIYIQDAAPLAADAFEFERPVVRKYGDVVIVNGALTGGSATIAVTDVFVLRDGRWRAVARHTSRDGITPAAATAAPDSTGL